MTSGSSLSEKLCACRFVFRCLGAVVLRDAELDHRIEISCQRGLAHQARGLALVLRHAFALLVEGGKRVLRLGVTGPLTVWWSGLTPLV